MKPMFDKKFIVDLIPQKHPFVMVDQMYDYNETSITSGLKVEPSNIFFDKNQLTESGLIEHIAQTVALHTGYQFYLKKENPPTGYIGSINQIEIKKLPNLNDEIQTRVTILQEFGGVTLVEIASKINEIEIATGQMKTVLAK